MLQSWWLGEEKELVSLARQGLLTETRDVNQVRRNPLTVFPYTPFSRQEKERRSRGRRDGERIECPNMVSLAADDPATSVANIMSKVAKLYLFLKLVAVLSSVHLRVNLICAAHHRPKVVAAKKLLN